MINSFVEIIFTTLLNKTIGISLLLIILMATRPFVLKYLNARVSYSMWLVVPLFFILPTDLMMGENASVVITIILGSNPLNPDQISEQFFENNLLQSVLLAVWIVGVVSSISLHVHRYIKLSRSLSRFDSIDENLAAIPINKSDINIVKSNLVDVPAVFGLFKSNLILPESFPSYSKINQAMILRHELFHLARHDHRINLVRVFMKSLFWFNPLVYISDKYCEADQEISCDLGVIQCSPLEEKKQYAKALIESASFGSQNKLVSQWKYHSLIKERVKMLKNTNTRAWHKWIAIVFSVSAIWLTNGVVMAQKSENISDIAPTIVEQPRYPRKAAEAGIGGWVKFKFDVDEFGKPYNVELIAAEPRRVFERDARRVIYKWKFGNNRSQKNVTYTMVFKVK